VVEENAGELAGGKHAQERSGGGRWAGPGKLAGPDRPDKGKALRRPSAAGIYKSLTRPKNKTPPPGRTAGRKVTRRAARSLLPRALLVAVRLQALAALVLVHLEAALLLQVAHCGKEGGTVFLDRAGRPRGCKALSPDGTTGEGRRPGRARKAYFNARAFAAWALPRDAAFLCTTPDFTALSIADT